MGPCAAPAFTEPPGAIFVPALPHMGLLNDTYLDKGHERIIQRRAARLRPGPV
jgi:hypothetical protein